MGMRIVTGFGKLTIGSVMVDFIKWFGIRTVGLMLWTVEVSIFDFWPTSGCLDLIFRYHCHLAFQATFRIAAYRTSHLGCFNFVDKPGTTILSTAANEVLRLSLM